MELSLMLRLKGTVILTIWRQVLFVVLYTAGLACVHNFTSLKINFPQTLIPVLGVVTGLLLVFRTNTAYDRYWEGRKLWSTMTLSIRILTRCIWVGVGSGCITAPTAGDVKDPKETVLPSNTNSRISGVGAYSPAAEKPLEPGVGVKKEEDKSRELVEKMSAINLLIAFAYATRNYLRGEYSHGEEDLPELISHLPSFSTPSSNQSLEAQETQEEKYSTPLRSRKSEKVDSPGVNLDSSKRPIICSPSASSKDGSRKTKDEPKPSKIKAYDVSVPTNVPIELSYYIASYINSVQKEKLADGGTIGMMNSALNTLVECLGGFERILRTPIPLAYSVHLHHATWLYILALPYQLIGQLNWFAIPAVGLAAFALLGILGIGWEIENPFGLDPNDLPLTDFCQVVHKEILQIIGHQMPATESWILSDENHPLSPQSTMTAKELMKRKEEDVRIFLEKGALRNLKGKEKPKDKGVAVPMFC